MGNVEFSIEASQNPVLVGLGVEVHLASVVSLKKENIFFHPQTLWDDLGLNY